MIRHLSPAEALAEAARIAGSMSALAREVGCSPQNIAEKVSKKRPIGAKHVLAAERATGISRHDLRPDIYPRESLAQAANA